MKTLIRETQVDLLGHLNNAVYLELFEQARWDMIQAGGYGFDKIIATQKGPVILEIKLKFIKEVRSREEITIQTKLESYSGKVGLLKQTMFKDGNILAAEMDVTFGFFDMKTRRLIDPTPEWLESLKEQ